MHTTEIIDYWYKYGVWFLMDTDLRVIFRLVGEAFFKYWIVLATHSSAVCEATCSWHDKYIFNNYLSDRIGEPIETCICCNKLTRVHIIPSTVLLEKHLLIISNLGCTREWKISDIMNGAYFSHSIRNTLTYSRNCFLSMMAVEQNDRLYYTRQKYWRCPAFWGILGAMVVSGKLTKSIY